MKGTPPENLVRDVFRCRPATSHLVWGSVVPDIPEFCSELVVTLVSAPAGEPYPIDTDGDGH